MKYYIFLIITMLGLASCKKETPNGPYNPDIKREDFTKSTVITNVYFPLSPGKKYIYKGKTADGNERIEEKRTSETKVIMGITCIVVKFNAFLNGILIEAAIDYYAQENDGNLWYFGEAVNNYNNNGTFKDHHGSWLAGVDGALPGIIMLAHPRRGKKYREEYYAGFAEDEAAVIATDQKVKTDFGNFEDCITTKNWSRLDPDLNENKIYAPGIGLIKEINLTDNTETFLTAIE